MSRHISSLDPLKLTCSYVYFNSRTTNKDILWKTTHIKTQQDPMVLRSIQQAVVPKGTEELNRRALEAGFTLAGAA